MDCGFWGAAEAKKKTLEFTTDDEVDGDDCDEWDCFIVIREGVQKNVFLWEISPKCGWVGCLIPKQGPKCVYPPTHARGFVRFGRTKGEI